MEIERTVSDKGQVVIPNDIRNKLGIKKGSEVTFTIEDGKIIIKRKMSPKEFVERFADVPKKIRGLTDKRLNDLLELEYEET